MTELTMQRSKKGEIDYITLLFICLTPLLAITGSILYLVFFGCPPWQTITLTIALFCLTGLSITIGYHRLLAHRTFTAHPLITIIILLFGAATFENSALKWCRDHRDHHTHTDTDKDPHSIKRGFFFAHMGWLFFKSDFNVPTEKNIMDLRQSKLVMLQHKFYFLIATLMGFVLPSLLGLLWHDVLGAFIFAALLRIVISHHATFCINSLTHMIGKNTYNKAISARDNFLLSLITFGEGYHNYHHAYPYDYRNGRRFYNFDPSKWIIYSLSFIGLTRNLRRAES